MDQPPCSTDQQGKEGEVEINARHRHEKCGSQYAGVREKPDEQDDAEELDGRWDGGDPIAELVEQCIQAARVVGGGDAVENKVCIGWIGYQDEGGEGNEQDCQRARGPTRVGADESFFHPWWCCGVSHCSPDWWSGGQVFVCGFLRCRVARRQPWLIGLWYADG